MQSVSGHAHVDYGSQWDLNTHRQKKSKHFQINKIFNVERLTDKTHLFKKNDETKPFRT